MGTASVKLPSLGAGKSRKSDSAGRVSIEVVIPVEADALISSHRLREVIVNVVPGIGAPASLRQDTRQSCPGVVRMMAKIRPNTALRSASEGAFRNSPPDPVASIFRDAVSIIPPSAMVNMRTE